jgi:23S rRNA (guanosine2251-2'-O)-methyltransferase
MKRSKPEKGSAAGQASHCFVYGIHAVRHALETSPEESLEMWIQAGTHNPALEAIRRLAGALGLAVQEVPVRTLDRLAEDGRHQGVVLRRRAPKLLNEADLTGLLGRRGSDPFILVLDGVEDPHNLGACLRTADAAGVDGVVIPLHRGVGLTATVSKVASGAVENVPLIQARNLARALRMLREEGLRVVGTADDAEQTLFDVDLTGPLALAMGGEGQGMRRLTREHCDVVVRIPMLGQVESLNVSVAAGICLYEILRQRMK